MKIIRNIARRPWPHNSSLVSGWREIQWKFGGRCEGKTDRKLPVMALRCENAQNAGE
jgi:hypothetical protein